jgi:predicted chitinase
MPVSEIENFPEHSQNFDRYALLDYAKKEGLSGKELAMFMANMSRETGGFEKSEENGYYSTVDRIKKVFPSKFYKTTINPKGKTVYTNELINPNIKPEDYVNNPEKLLNHVYSNKNGNLETGDGYKYRGRGYVQLTGRENYQKYGKKLKDLGLLKDENELINNPELAKEPGIASAIAVEFWKDRSRPLVETLPNKWDNPNALKKSMIGITGNQRADFLKKTKSAYKNEKNESYFNEQTPAPAQTPTPTSTPAQPQTGFLDKVKEYGGKAYDTLFPSAEASPMPVNNEEEIPEFKMPETVEEIPEFKMPESEPQQREEVFAPPRKEMGKLKAGVLGGLQGLTFGFADELEALTRSALGNKTYDQNLSIARTKYKKAQEDQPWTYGSSELGVGIASSFIPVVGQLGAAGVAARAGKAAKDVITAKRGIDAASKAARAAEVVASGAVGGGLGSIGTSEADLLAKQTPEAAAELAKDIGTGALTGAAFGRATQKIGDSERVQKVAKRIRESRPVKAAENLLDTVISGGKDAIEQGRIFIGKPEKVKEVEHAFKAGGFENVKQAQKDVKSLVREKAKDAREVTKLTNEYNQTKRQLQDEINDVKRAASTERSVQQMELGKQTDPLRKEYNDVKQALNKLGPQIDATEQKIQAQVQQLNKSLDNQSAEAIKNLYDNQLGKITELGKQRDKFLDSSLSKVAADEADAQQLQDAIVDMYSIYKNDYETSIVPVLTKILRNEPRFEQMSNIVTDKNRIANIKDAVLQGKYSKAEVIKMLENAKKELYTPLSNTTPSGVARREAYQILNEKLRTIAPDEYNQFNRELNKFMTTRDVLEDSPLLKGFTVTKTGQKGGQIAETQYMPVTERPSIEKLPKDYLDELQSKGFDVSLLQRQEKILEDALTKEQLLPLETMKAELTIKSNALRRQIQELRSKASMSSAEEQVKLNDLINKKTDDLNLYRSKMTMKLSKMREDLADKYAEKIGQARDNLEALEEQARKETIAYSDLAKSGLTADEAARMVSTGTIGRQMPQGFYRLLRPTPMTRIKVYNAISKRFRNPALTAAIAPRIGQGLTDEDIMSLSTTHEVDPNELKQVLTEQGMSAP